MLSCARYVINLNKFLFLLYFQYIFIKISGYGDILYNMVNYIIIMKVEKECFNLDNLIYIQCKQQRAKENPVVLLIVVLLQLDHTLSQTYIKDGQVRCPLNKQIVITFNFYLLQPSGFQIQIKLCNFPFYFFFFFF